jgi:hypothetical protein
MSKILVLNPAYDVFDFPDSAKEFAASGVTRENINDPLPDFSTTPAVWARNVLKRQNGVSAPGVYVRVEGNIRIKEYADQLQYRTCIYQLGQMQ